MEQALQPGADRAALPPAHAAATLIVMDDAGADDAGADGAGGALPQFLMVQCSTRLAFAGGATVFPGGRVDRDDVFLAARSLPGGSTEDALADMAARIAAIRETLEETGLAIALAEADGTPLPHGAMSVAQSGRVAALRAGLAAGEGFAASLAVLGLDVLPERLVPHARWCPALGHARRFDTRFYIAQARGAAAIPLAVDATENTALRWCAAAALLHESAQGGGASVIFPTRRTLERLSLHADYGAAVADAAAHGARLIEPWIAPGPDGPMLCIPDDRGYPVTRERLESAMRG